MMRYIPNDKYTIAWFKLAECVSKGEKEKAFGVYRLLMHSFDDQAYAYQLEGDLLGAFQDQRAIEKYAHAAQLYVQNNRFKEAAIMYEELIFMMPQEITYTKRFIELYNTNKNKDLVLKKITGISLSFIEKKMYYHTMQIVEFFNAEIAIEEISVLYQKIALVCIKNNDVECDARELLFNLIISFLLKSTQQKKLQEILSVLCELDKIWYNKAITLLKDSLHY